MHVSTVAGIDDRYGSRAGRHESSAFLRVANCHHVYVIGHSFQSVRNGFALGHGSELGAGETDHLAAKSEHGGFKAQTRTGAGLIKQSGKHPAFAGVCHFFTMRINRTAPCGVIPESGEWKDHPM